MWAIEYTNLNLADQAGKSIMLRDFLMGPGQLGTLSERRAPSPPYLFFCWRAGAALLAIALIVAGSGCKRAPGQSSHGNEDAPGVTDISIGHNIRRTGIKRLGINLNGQTFYDSGQMLRDLTFRNPGFEGESWQSILRCKKATASSCTDDNRYASWPDNFLRGAQFEFISGPAKGLGGKVESSIKAGIGSPEAGVKFTFDRLQKTPDDDDFVMVRFNLSGDPDKGWWVDSMHTGATFTAELKDLSPRTPGKQALRINAEAPGEAARLDSYFDNSSDRSFLKLNGRYRLTFRAKGDGGNNSLDFGISRNGSTGNNETLLARTTLKLPHQWKDYSYPFVASEDGSRIGTVDLNFSVSGANILLDDVSVTEEPGSDNPTAFRDAVVNTLRTLKPGIIRYSGTGVETASTIDNMIAPPDARVRAGYSTQATFQDAIPMGLHEFLELCEATGAEPWYSLPATATPDEANHLIEYLAGAPSSPYGAKRAARGHPAPWTSVFPVIHLEFGNELWNKDTFYGAAIGNAEIYAQRGDEIFAGAKSSAWYSPGKFDLILGSWAVNTDWTARELANATNYDSVAVAPYLFYKLDATTSVEAAFGPMFAEPETVDSLPQGYMTQQAEAARKAAHPANLAVYEVNLGTDQGSASQSEVSAVVPSIGAGITLADHMLLMMRDLGITSQAAFALPQYRNRFRNPADPSEMTPLWGMTIDMGGPTNLRRPQFLAEQLANEAILPNMLETKLNGANPYWVQNKNNANEIEAEKAHYLQAFAFSDATLHSMIVFNLHRSKVLPITLSGEGAPSGPVEVLQLTSGHITDTNEQSSKVQTTTAKINWVTDQPYSLPPFSMTVFRWKSDH
jgi:alpha-L-arabinofuranosidase